MGTATTGMTGISIPQTGCLTDLREFPIVNKEKCIERIWNIGHDTDWYYGEWLWKLRGIADRMIIDAGGSSRIDALDFEVNEIELEAGGAAQVRVNASDYIRIDASGLSNVRYKGDAEVSIDKSGGSTVSRY